MRPWGGLRPLELNLLVGEHGHPQVLKRWKLKCRHWNFYEGHLGALVYFHDLLDMECIVIQRKNSCPSKQPESCLDPPDPQRVLQQNAGLILRKGRSPESKMFRKTLLYTLAEFKDKEKPNVSNVIQEALLRAHNSRPFLDSKRSRVVV
ncbi:hypothetical protein CDAR_494451 [Caerostris darwini]|uniref:Ribosomal protein S7 n=1 Tax=Caerostris darwini TaxID=1538125 RepID=A0AAV4SKX0_9ARAC|nr:hypothetical protein CDAR_494451 [Caerostris darwini]